MNWPLLKGHRRLHSQSTFSSSSSFEDLLLVLVGEEPVGKVQQPQVDRAGVGVDVVVVDLARVEA